MLNFTRAQLYELNNHFSVFISSFSFCFFRCVTISPLFCFIFFFFLNGTNEVSDKTKNAALAAQIIRNSQIVCFDVDSTVIREEGIDELAKYCGKGQEVARLTKEAMKGSMTFQEALRLRLNIIQPSQRQIRDFLKAHPSTLSPGIK